MSANGPRATLRTIAEITGLSLSTVSLSLRGGGNLRDDTNDRIARAAESVGYIPNRAGVRLRTGKTNVIVLVLDGAMDTVNFARQLIKGIGDSIRGSRYHLTVMPEFDRNASVETIRYILDNRIADGIIITHTAPRDPRVQAADRSRLSLCHSWADRVFHPARLSWHDDLENYTRLAVERLVALGSRRLMTLVGDDRTFNYHNMVTSFRRSIQAAGVEGRIIGDDIVNRSSAQAMRAFGTQLAQSPDRPDGILCDGEIPAMALASGLRAGGVEIGRDIRMVCKQTSDLPALFPEIESIEENVHEAGRELTRLLLERIGGTRPELLQTLAEPVVHFPSRES